MKWFKIFIYGLLWFLLNCNKNLTTKYTTWSQGTNVIICITIYIYNKQIILIKKFRQFSAWFNIDKRARKTFYIQINETGALKSTDMKVLTDKKNKNPPYKVPLNFHFTAIWTKFNEFYIPIFDWEKNRESVD